MLLAMSESNITSKPILLGKNYFLIGFMGTGKSHWGKLWAAANKLTFVDLDELIEKEEDSTIAALRATTMELSRQQRLMMEAGAMTAQQIAHSKMIVDIEVKEVP